MVMKEELSLFFFVPSVEVYFRSAPCLEFRVETLDKNEGEREGRRAPRKKCNRVLQKLLIAIMILAIGFQLMDHNFQNKVFRWL